MTAPGPGGPGTARRTAEALLGPALFAAFLAIVVVHLVDHGRDARQEHLRLTVRRHFRHHPALRDAITVVQDVGTAQVMGTVALLVAVLLVLRRHRVRALLVLGSAYAVGYSVGVCKLLVREPAVDTAFGKPIGSFPSGHTADTTVVVGMLLVTLLPPRLRWAASVTALVVGGFVGFTRVAGGAHSPDDVVAGLLLGLSFVVSSGAWLAARLRVRG